MKSIERNNNEVLEYVVISYQVEGKIHSMHLYTLAIIHISRIGEMEARAKNKKRISVFSKYFINFRQNVLFKIRSIEQCRDYLTAVGTEKFRYRPITSI